MNFLMKFSDFLGFDFAYSVKFGDLLVEEGDIALVLWGHDFFFRGDHVETLVERLELTGVDLASFSETVK